MEQYTVTGMTCAACQARVEKAVSAVPGVTSCAVSLLTNSMGIEGSAAPSEIIAAVENAGYGAAPRSADPSASSRLAAEEEALKDTTTPLLKKRLFTSLGFLIILMYFSMGHMMWNWPIPDFFDRDPVALGILEMLLAIIVMVINQHFFISGFKSLFHRSPNMDTLVAMGSFASFVYSVFALFLMADAQQRGDAPAAAAYLHEFYFESAAMILTLITVGKMLEAHSKGKTTDALKSLMKLAPKTATLLVGGNEKTVSISQVQKGDIFVVYPGESIPVDGVVKEGNSAVNEAALTGESLPVDKAPGDPVSAATINQSGFLTCKATRVGEDTTLSQIIRMVSDAAATKAPIAKIADKVSGIFVPSVIAIAVITVIIWLLTGQSFGYALARGIAVLVISCPCALGLATPVAIMVGNGLGAKNGILFKTAVSQEETGRAQIVVLDKTGTITAGTPRVTDLLPAPGISEDRLLTDALCLEARSEHPLAQAIVEYCADKHMLAAPISDFQVLPGNGLMGTDENGTLYGGNETFISAKTEIPEEAIKQARDLASKGKTPLYFARIAPGHSPRFLGTIAVADVLKDDSKQAIGELKHMGLHVVMLTGDNQQTADAIGKEAGVNEVIAGVLPDGKEAVIRQLQEKGKVIMVGDGINDAPALTRADIGIAIGAGTDVAIDAADVVLMKSVLSDVSGAVRLSRATLRNIHENLFWAFFYNIIGIPLAAGAYISLFGWALSPMYGAAAMSLSSFFVVSNALRLNLFKVHDPSGDKPLRHPLVPDTDGKLLDHTTINNQTEDSDMFGKNKKTIVIEGMMCNHCEASVKKALEALPDIEEATVSHEKGTAVVKLAGDSLDAAAVQKAIEEKDFKFVEIK
ncbi:MAG: heavy metal translocating P-type ATPase [Lachnospiraceae bacterium]|nr:heavy metal translocating P-type ATPase [Lachnospiraceae bacterium]